MKTPHSKYPLTRQSSKRLIAWANRDLKAAILEIRLAKIAAVRLERNVSLMHESSARNLRSSVNMYLSVLRSRKVCYIQTPSGYQLL